MEFGIFNLMGSRDPEKPTAEVFAEVAEQTRLADELGYTIAWFAEHHFSNYCLCASPLMLVAHCASITKQIRFGTAVVVLPLYNPARLLAEQYQIIKDAYHAEGVPLANAHITVNRFCHITDSKEDGLRFAENARYQSRLASSLRRRQEVMQGTVLVDKPFPDEPPLEQIYNDLLIGDVETVAEKLVGEIRATHPVHMCFSFKVGATPHHAAMRSMELMMSEVRPRVERALGPRARSAAE